VQEIGGSSKNLGGGIDKAGIMDTDRREGGYRHPHLEAATSEASRSRRAGSLRSPVMDTQGVTMSEITKTRDGYYLLGEGQGPSEVAAAVYGNVNKYAEISTVNSDLEWLPGTHILVPNKEGRTTVVQENETTFEVISRMFPNQPVHLYLDRFYMWNDGFDAEDLVGVMVFIPER